MIKLNGFQKREKIQYLSIMLIKEGTHQVNKSSDWDFSDRPVHAH